MKHLILLILAACCGLSVQAQVATQPNTFTYWGLAFTDTNLTAGTSMWYDYENGFVYRSNSTTNGLCSPCPIGSVPKDGGVGCQVCPTGTTTIAAGDARCSPCTDELNLFSNASTYGVCSTCASGTIFSPDKGSCVPCPAGTFHLAPHVPLCVPCPAGSFSTAGVTACSQCPPNTFSNEDTKGNCESCTPPLVPTRSQNGCIFVPPPPVASVAAPENGSSTIGGNDASSLASSSSNFVTIAAALCLSFVIFL